MHKATEQTAIITEKHEYSVVTYSFLLNAIHNLLDQSIGIQHHLAKYFSVEIHTLLKLLGMMRVQRVTLKQTSVYLQCARTQNNPSLVES